jgi:hypothetical protein
MYPYDQSLGLQRNLSEYLKRNKPVWFYQAPDEIDKKKVKTQKRAQDPIALRIFDKAIIPKCRLNIS